ncbi:MAG: hypothetical protein LBJ35_01195 [Spirochaetaceae bacterium]|jgi:chromosome segregation ATPase|nr:hypothetical protein [Spirochaetaceae bacterium]
MLNGQEVKEELGKLYETKEKYTVVFSGKKSGKINGLYKPACCEIVIHDKNFENDNLLMYTAIHELAHHIQNTERGEKTTRAHTNLFWAVFYDLVDKAEEAGIYAPDIDEDMKKLIEEARDISKETARLQRKLGEVIIKINEACGKKGLRTEDIVERRAQISRAGMIRAAAARNLGDCGVGADIQEEAAREKNSEKRAAIIRSGRAGKSVAQIKYERADAREVKTNEIERLTLERGRINRTIEALKDRLEEITKEIDEKSEGRKEWERKTNFYGEIQPA